MANSKNFITGGRADRAAVHAWVRLAHGRDAPGAVIARKLLTRFGLPQHIFAASAAALRACVSAQLAEVLATAPCSNTLALIDQTHAWLALPGHSLLTLADEHYPAALLTIADPPLLLYVTGRIALLQRPAVAVVGSRNASRQGLLHAERFSESFSMAGLTVVSGLALGIDSAAHEGGLKGIGGTVAVIGTGIDLVYPLRNAALAERIAQQGCVVSEYPLGMPPLPANFPRRNRLISGLSRAVLVVEAALRSGSLITARVAADQGREVFAIPGSIHSPMSKGCHALIKQGAKLVDSMEDVLEELTGFDGKPVVGAVSVSVSGAESCNQSCHEAGAGFSAELSAEPAADLQFMSEYEAAPIHVAPPVKCASPKREVVDSLDEGETKDEDEDENNDLLKILGYDPATLDQLAARSGDSTGSLQGRLLLLELAGRVELLPGGGYRRLE
jgi:DNA processing protein